MRTDLQVISSQSLPAASIANRGINQPARDGSKIFSQSLTEASARLTRECGQASTTRLDAAAISPLLQTTPLSNGRTSPLQSEISQDSQDVSDSSSGMESQIVTPFGTFTRTPPNTSNGASASQPESDKWGPMSGMRAYFYTHQPGEWFSDPEARRDFEAIYGTKALVTLDWTLTVPENQEQEWVTNRPLDETGRPLPKTLSV